VAYGHGPIAVVTDHGTPTAGGPVVVGLDDSPEAEAALRIAVTEAVRLEVPVRAVHAWDLTPWMVGPMGVSSLMALPDTEKLAERINDIVEPYRKQYPALTIDVDVVEARPSAALVEASVGASVVVVGSRGLGGFTGLLLGSTSKEVLRDAACPCTVWTNDTAPLRPWNKAPKTRMPPQPVSFWINSSNGCHECIHPVA